MPSADHEPAVIAYGEVAFLVELGSAAHVAAYTRALRAATLAGVEELVPAARTVLVRFDPSAARPETLRRALASLAVPLADASAADIGVRRADRVDPVVIDVHYDGEDLAEVARLCDLTVADVIERHQAATYHSAFCGFAPGFAYLTGLDERLVVPRLDTPRPRVAAGSVAIAGEFAGVYPNDMPGGWRIIGHTDAVLWDLDRPQPALLAPGTAVRFRSVPR